MEAVTVKFQEGVLKKIDKSTVEHNYNSRTEFIREAVRDKLSELSKEDLIKHFLKFRGKAKKKTIPLVIGESIQIVGSVPQCTSSTSVIRSLSLSTS